MRSTTTLMTTPPEERITSTLFIREFLTSALKTGDPRITSREQSTLTISSNILNNMARNSIFMTRLFCQQIKKEVTFMFISHPLSQEKTRLRSTTTRTISPMPRKEKMFQLKSLTLWKIKSWRETTTIRTFNHIMLTTSTVEHKTLFHARLKSVLECKASKTKRKVI